MLRLCLLFAFFFSVFTPVVAAEPVVKVLIVDGQNNHAWKETTPVLKELLETTKRFSVDVATSPAKDTTGFAPKFKDYGVIVLNYNGADWPKDTQMAFDDFVKTGGGVVVVHAADNSFPKWKEFNEMIGLGGWGGRTEKDGPYIRYREGKIVRDESAGRGGSHGKQHEFVVEHINTEHPITKGLPTLWKHAGDELYDRLRGPAKNLTVLATAYSNKSTGGTGENEPILFTISYEKGRVFHTTLGHSVAAMNCVGFATTYQRGTEWAATGKVTLPAPNAFPKPDQVLPVKK